MRRSVTRECSATLRPRSFSPAVCRHIVGHGASWNLGGLFRKHSCRLRRYVPGGAERCQALEAALFMIGYDLRCLVVTPVLPSITASVPSAERTHAKRVAGSPALLGFRPVSRFRRLCGTTSSAVSLLAIRSKWLNFPSGKLKLNPVSPVLLVRIVNRSAQANST